MEKLRFRNWAGVSAADGEGILGRVVAVVVEERIHRDEAIG
jgi:hypothetical protein